MRSRRALRFARALALVSSVGCGGAPPAAPATTAASHPAPVDPCATCSCDSASVNPRYCDARGSSGCCGPRVIVLDEITGPLPPPDLPA